MNKLGEKIRGLLAKRGVSQNKLSRLIGEDTAVLSKYIRGERKFPRRVLELIAETLDVDYEELLEAGGDGVATELAQFGSPTYEGYTFVPERLAALMAKQSMTVKDLLRVADVSSPNYYRWMHRRSQPSIASLEKLGTYFGVDPHHFLVKTEEAPKESKPGNGAVTSIEDSMMMLVAIPKEKLAAFQEVVKAFSGRVCGKVEGGLQASAPGVLTARYNRGNPKQGNVPRPEGLLEAV